MKKISEDKKRNDKKERQKDTHTERIYNKRTPRDRTKKRERDIYPEEKPIYKPFYLIDTPKIPNK